MTDDVLQVAIIDAHPPHYDTKIVAKYALEFGTITQSALIDDKSQSWMAPTPR